MKKTLLYLLGATIIASCSQDKKDPRQAAIDDEGRNMHGYYLERGLLTNKEGLEDGYVMFYPPVSAEAFLVNRKGEVVHTWKGNYEIFNGYLQNDGSIFVNAYDQDFLTFHGGGKNGRLQRITADSEVVWDFEYAFEDTHVHHDFEVLPNGNLLAIAWEVKGYDEAVEKGRNPEFLPKAGLWPDKVIEIRPTDKYHGEIVWEWHIWDHLIQSLDSTKTNFGIPSEHPELLDINASAEKPKEIHPDTLKLKIKNGQASPNATVENEGSDVYHFNAIDYNAELDQIALSSPHLNEVIIIDHSTSSEEAAGHTGGRYGRGGDILYRWGNPENYGKGDSTNRKLFFQHDIRWVEQGAKGYGNLTLYNNNVPLIWDSIAYSMVYEITPPINEEGSYALQEDGTFGPESPTWAYMAEDTLSFHSGYISGAMRLANGNTFITEGAEGRFFEVTPEGEIVWEYRNPFRGNVRMPNGDYIDDSYPKAYRTFRATYIPPDHPGLSALDLTPDDPQPEPFVNPIPEPKEKEKSD